ncbi:MAG: hypothetical protein Q4Q07_01455 [Tissierellia bacterium]|nr:hypothetical protein [Tissierellia bacterium]
MKISKLFQYIHAFRTSLEPYMEELHKGELYQPGGVSEHLILWKPELIATWLSFDVQQTPKWTVDYVKNIMKSFPDQLVSYETMVPKLYDSLTKGYVSLFYLTDPVHVVKQEMKDLLLNKSVRLHFTQRERMDHPYVLGRVFSVDHQYFFFDVIGSLSEEEGEKFYLALKDYFYGELKLEKISIADLKTLFPEMLQLFIDFKNTVSIVSEPGDMLHIDDFLSYYFSKEDEAHFRRFYYSFTRKSSLKEKDSIWYSMHKFFINYLVPMEINFSTLTPGLLKTFIIQGAQQGIFYQKRELLWLLIILRSWFEFAYIDTKDRKYRELLETVQLLQDSFFELLRMLRDSSKGIYTDAGLMNRLHPLYLPLKGGVLDDFKDLILNLDGHSISLEEGGSFFPVNYDLLKEELHISFRNEKKLGNKGAYLYSNVLYYFALNKNFLTIHNTMLTTTENFYSYLELSKKEQLVLWIHAIFHTDFLDDMLGQLPYHVKKSELSQIFNQVVHQEAIKESQRYIFEILRSFYLVDSYTSTRYALTEFGEEVFSYIGLIPNPEPAKILKFPKSFKSKK